MIRFETCRRNTIRGWARWAQCSISRARCWESEDSLWLPFDSDGLLLLFFILYPRNGSHLKKYRGQSPFVNTRVRQSPTFLRRRHPASGALGEAECRSGESLASPAFPKSRASCRISSGSGSLQGVSCPASHRTEFSAGAGQCWGFRCLPSACGTPLGACGILQPKPRAHALLCVQGSVLLIRGSRVA